MTKLELSSILEPMLQPHSEELRRLALEGSWALSRRFPTADALIYDNYNFVVCGWSFTGKPGDAFLSLAVASKHAAVCFLQGARLDDPEGRLRGGGKIVRNLRLESLDLLEDPYVSRLIEDAAAMAKGGESDGKAILRSISPVKRRPKAQT